MADEILDTRPIYRGWLDLLLARVRLNGREEERPVIEHPSGSAVLAYDPDRRVALVVEQTRVAVMLAGERPMPEAIAGVAENGGFAATARREAEEEGGVRLPRVERVGTVFMDPNSSTERVHLFLAEYALHDRIGAGGGLAEENERLAVRELPLRDLWDELTNRQPADARTLLLAQALRLRRPELFEPV